jgi:hypothetical protein
MVLNTAYAPMDFRVFAAQPSFAIHIDTWDLARDEPSFVEPNDIDLTDLAARPCTAQSGSNGPDCSLLTLLETYGPTRASRESEVTVGAEQAPFTVMYLDFPGHDEETWKERYVSPQGNALRSEWAGAKRVFVHPFIARAESGAAGGTARYELVLQYWFFYPINDGPNNHEGDWEHINVIVSPRSKVERPLDPGEMEGLVAAMAPPDGDDPLVLRRVEYYFHHSIYAMDFSAPNVYLPREAWRQQADRLARRTHGEQWLQESIRARAWQDEAETRINTRPILWIGGDAVGAHSVLDMPGGLKDRDGHASYPFRGYYTEIGPGVGERVMRAFDHRSFFSSPSERPDYVEDYGSPDKVALLPDWERLSNLVLSDSPVRREWAWFLLPVRFGYPASPSPAAGLFSHVDTGNTSVVGPSFNGGWNRIGDATGFATYEAVKMSWATPLTVVDSFLPRAGFFNAPIVYMILKSPYDLAWHALSLPVRAVIGDRQPTFRPGNKPAQRLISAEVGTLVTPVSERFVAAFFNRDQFLEIVERILQALPPGAPTSGLETVGRFPTVAAPIYSIVFHPSRRFSTESILAPYSARVGFDVTSPELAQPVEVRSRLEQFDFHGNLRFNLMTGSFQPYVRYGTGLTWYQLKNVSVDGDVLTVPDSPKFQPKGSWLFLGFNETILGGGVDLSPMRLGRIRLGLKASYSAIHHPLGFEQEAAVESSAVLAQQLAGQIYSVWRHEMMFTGTISF